MNNSHSSIRNLTAIALLVFGSMSVALASSPSPGKVTRIDQSAHTFTVQWLVHAHRSAMGAGNSIERTFKTTDKTVYTLEKAKGSWADLKKGVHVIVTAHAGVADKVQIVSGS